MDLWKLLAAFMLVVLVALAIAIVEISSKPNRRARRREAERPPLFGHEPDWSLFGKLAEVSREPLYGVCAPCGARYAARDVAWQRGRCTGCGGELQLERPTGSLTLAAHALRAVDELTPREREVLREIRAEGALEPIETTGSRARTPL